jgi:O-antigen/teichoic acid export membrane protein
MRTACVVAAAAAAVGCAIAALGCLLAALWIYARPHVGAVGAPLVVAGVLLAIGLAVLGLMRHKLKRRPPPPPAGDALASLLAEATRLLKEHKGSVLTVALLAGFVAGRNGK